MSRKIIAAFAASLALLGGCAQNSSTDDMVPERGDPNFLKAKNIEAGELYVADDPGENARSFREIYIAPADLSKVQIIQPEGVDSDEEWQVSDVEGDTLQKAVADEFATTLSFESAYNIVETADQSDMILHTTVVAIHPYATKAEVDAGAKEGGAVTISLALVNTQTDKVMIRSVATRSTDDIWAFHEVEDADPALNLIFRAWGNNVRRGLLNLQGRASNPLDAEPLLLKPQQ
jgi:hypothetical protein